MIARIQCPSIALDTKSLQCRIIGRRRNQFQTLVGVFAFAALIRSFIPLESLSHRLDGHHQECPPAGHKNELSMNFVFRLLRGALAMTALLGAHPAAAQAALSFTIPELHHSVAGPAAPWTCWRAAWPRACRSARTTGAVENRPGPTCISPPEPVTRAKPDAHTFCMINNDNMVILPHLEKISYDTQKDFARRHSTGVLRRRS